MRHSIYTDGSAYWKDGSAGYGVVFVTGKNRIEASWEALPQGTTVQQAEMWAVIKALQLTDPSLALTIYSDSEYVVNTMGTWGREWLRSALRYHGVAVFPSDTLLDLYAVYRSTIGDDTAMELVNSSEELVKNQTLWEKLWELLLKRDVIFEWVPGHSKDPFDFNNVADTFAGKGRQECIQKYNLGEH